MTEKQYKNFISMNEKFIDRCSQVCSLLQPINSSYGYLDTFEPDGDRIYGKGDEYWGYGGHEEHSNWFPSKYLWMKDEEIKDIVNKELEDRENKKREKKEQEERLQIEREREIYEKLKRKFE